MKLGILNFINSEEESLELSVKPLDYWIDILKQLGYKKIKYNSNGWQVDFWITFQNLENSKWLMLSGSLWYGNYVLVKIDEEDENENN